MADANTQVSVALARLSDPVNERLGYYVYRLVDRRNNQTFYVGKGKGGRLLQHVADARSSAIESRKLNRIREIEAGGGSISFLVHRHGLTEKEAYEVEAALIDVYPQALNEVEGHHSRDRGCMPLEEVVAIYHPPKTRIAEPVVLINIGQEWLRGLSDDPERLYERTRRYWACAPNRHDAKYAIAVSRGVIRQVYRIDKWSKHDMTKIQLDAGRVATHRHKIGTQWRWSFEGAPDPEMNRRYVGNLVDPPRERGDSNPIKWVNC